ncbi:MAG: M24 family metallopeptidase [Phycisphaerae bacterium]
MDLASVQQYMRDEKIDAWLLYDFRGSNSVFARLLPEKHHTTRRIFLFIPATGEPVLLTHGLDANQFTRAGVRSEQYLSWPQLRDWLAATLAGRNRVAMEYAPGCSLPVVSMVDAGTVELVRSLGVEVVSSANLIQVHVARWSAAAVGQHRVASKQVDTIKDEAFALIRERLAAGRDVHEVEVQQFILKRFESDGLETPDPPIVAVNAHSGDPHFEPSPKTSAPIRRGDWVLIDLWARRPGDENIFSDVTWCGFAGRDVPAEHRRVFDTVRAARDASVQRAVDAWTRRERLQGWQLDDAARDVIEHAGYGEFIKHRTGHSLSPGPMVHGLGFNLDNLETHDTRDVLAGLGFTVEPGIYTPSFGVRLELNMYVDPTDGPVVTSGLQKDVILLA